MTRPVVAGGGGARVVLVTGAARRMASRLAGALAAERGVARVVAVDTHEPRHDLGGARFVRADIRQPVIAKVIAQYGVDTVAHLDVSETEVGEPGRGAAKETNVIGTMQLLGACQRMPGVRRLVVKSTTGVYGAASRDPAVFTEPMSARSLPRSGFARDATEVEDYVRGFGRRRPDVAVCVLRFANVLGPVVDTPLGAYLALPVIPTVLGFDPRLQFVHEDDALAVLRLACLEPRAGTLNSGTFNVAGDGVMLLSQVVRRLGRPTVPVARPAMSAAFASLRLLGLGWMSAEQIRLLTHGRVVDTSELRQTFGYHPRYGTAAAFADFARGRGVGPRVVTERDGA